MKKLKDFILLIVMLLSTGVVAQNYTITGKVTESGNNMPIPGASIMIKGTSTGTISDIDGNYTINNVPGDAELEISFVGMESQMISVEGRTVINVELLISTTALEEVVMVGYGIQKKSDLTGAMQRLTAKDLEKSVATSPIEMMQGRTSGVNITQNSGEPGSGMTVRVRGSNSIRSGQEPLYVVDGIPLDNTDITPDGGSAAGYGGGSNKNPISFLNPEDIESIDILKDASSTAIYGARGANGVVIITTKQGKSGQSQLSYSGYIGVSNIRKKLELVTADEFRSYRTQSGEPLLDEGANTDWQDEIFQSSLTRSHNLSIGGGSDKAVYQASLGYLVQDGIINTTSMEKLNGKLNITHNAFKGRLKLTESLIASRITDSRAPITENEGSGAEGDLLLTALSLNPTYPVLNGDASYYQKSTLERNPVAMLNLIDDETVTDRILANISANLTITNNLNYKLNVSLDQTNAERRVNQDNDLTYLVDDGEADINSVTATNKLIENYFTYNLKAGKNSLNFLLGHAYQNFQGTTSEINVTGFQVEDIKYTDNIEYGNFSQATTSSSTYERELQSFFGRINYNYNEKYLITVTGRMDGSSKFGENNKYGFFPSASFAWRLTQEEFLKNADLLSNLKLRLSYGLTGNQEIPDKVSQISVGTSNDASWFVDGQFVPGITFNRTPNPDIQWETTQQANVGVDFGIYKGRLSGTFDVYNKVTRDVLLEVTSNAPAPAQTTWLNLPDCKIINNGIELALNGVIIDNNDWHWDVGVGFDRIKNEVQDLPVALIQTGAASGPGLTGTQVQIITNGQPIGTFYGLVFEGFDADGNSIYKTDAEGNEVKEYLGSALPDYTYNFKTSVSYKNWEFRMLWYGSQGNKVYNNTANSIFTKGPLENGNNVTKEVYESAEDPGNSNAFSSRFIEDGSFLRLSNITIGYTFSVPTLEWLSNARIYATGNNLLLFTDYSGYDPEVNANASVDGVPSLGIDYTSYPKSRTFTLGVNLSF